VRIREQIPECRERQLRSAAAGLASRRGSRERVVNGCPPQRRLADPGFTD
jgi:hypothetical protein